METQTLPETLWAIDTETRGLDATKFILACWKRANQKKTKTYTDKKKLWQNLIETAQKETLRGKTPTIYHHNANYDIHAYANLKDKNLTWHSHKPFIATLKGKRKIHQKKIKNLQLFLKQHETDEHYSYKPPYYYYTGAIIHFLDTMNIYNMSLAKAAKLINKQKKEMPKSLLGTQYITKKEIQKIQPYCENDTQLVIDLILHIRQKLKEDNIHIKRLYTKNQIAINYVNQQLKKTNKTHHLYKENKGIPYETQDTYRATEIHEAYRGGRVEAFQTGIFPQTTYLDRRSMYCWSITQIQTPNLKTERKHWKPLQRGHTLKKLLQQTGISRAILTNDNNNIGLLQIRTNTNNYYPKKGKILIGTWTHPELLKAINEGYTIHDIEWSITWETLPTNPFKPIYEELYKKRNVNNEFDRYFYKTLANCSIGKMAQQRGKQHIIIDTVEAAQHYIKKNYEILRGIHYDYVYRKTEKTKERKPYYMPIIPTLVNAHARLTMYEDHKKIPTHDLLYTDTDSIIYKGQHHQKFDIGNNLGQYKIEHDSIKQPKKSIIYGRKTYSFNTEPHASGTPTRQIKPEDFETGYLTTTTMQTWKQTLSLTKAGTFKTTKRNLKTEQENAEKSRQLLDQQTIYIDHNINDINHFLPTITNIGNTLLQRRQKD